MTKGARSPVVTPKEDPSPMPERGPMADAAEVSIEPEESITDILSGRGLPLVTATKVFYIRPPSPEEYDDAMALQTLVRRRTLADPQIVELKNLPITPEHRQGLEVTVKDMENRLKELDLSSPEINQVESRLSEFREMLRSRTLAEQTADERATLARDRWLTARLLTYEDGRQVFSTNGKDFAKKWQVFPVRVKNEARPLIWLLLRMVENAPFDLE